MLLFINAGIVFVISLTVSMWYFNQQGANIFKSIYYLIRYHIGSIALGSFIIFTLKTIKAMVDKA